MSVHCQPVLEISIHAPARGATRCFALEVVSRTISIHAPARGATSFPAILDQTIEFQSTLPRGERRMADISRKLESHHFNPRSREGSDKRSRTKNVKSTKFQSTLPRGERLYVLLGVYDDDLFQSTLPRGERRDSVKSKRANYGISIHAPARGATAGFTVLTDKKYLFQSTLPRGERPADPAGMYSHQYFNPRSREGSDICSHPGKAYIDNFNPRSREGSDKRIIAAGAAI